VTHNPWFKETIIDGTMSAALEEVKDELLLLSRHTIQLLCNNGSAENRLSGEVTCTSGVVWVQNLVSRCRRQTEVSDTKIRRKYLGASNINSETETTYMRVPQSKLSNHELDG
jgi:hypothetical protein